MVGVGLQCNLKKLFAVLVGVVNYAELCSIFNDLTWSCKLTNNISSGDYRDLTTPIS